MCFWVVLALNLVCILLRKGCVGWGHHLQDMSLTGVYLIIKKFSRFKHLRSVLSLTKEKGPRAGNENTQNLYLFAVQNTVYFIKKGMRD